MNREFPPVYTAVTLLLACIGLRLIGSHFAEALPNISPMMALAYVGAMYLPRKWGWLIGPVALLLTDIAFLGINFRTDGSGTLFSSWTVIAFAFAAVLYVAASLFGFVIARRRSLTRILGGSIVCSVVFYVATNTYSWFFDSFIIHMTGGYSATLAGWWQANTTGLPGYDPAWLFLRNGAAGDLFFAIVLLLVFDRGLLFRPSAAKAPARLA